MDSCKTQRTHPPNPPQHHCHETSVCPSFRDCCDDHTHSFGGGGRSVRMPPAPGLQLQPLRGAGLSGAGRCRIRLPWSSHRADDDGQPSVHAPLCLAGSFSQTRSLQTRSLQARQEIASPLRLGRLNRTALAVRRSGLIPAAASRSARCPGTAVPGQFLFRPPLRRVVAGCGAAGRWAAIQRCPAMTRKPSRNGFEKLSFCFDITILLTLRNISP